MKKAELRKQLPHGPKTSVGWYAVYYVETVSWRYWINSVEEPLTEAKARALADHHNQTSNRHPPKSHAFVLKRTITEELSNE